MQMLATWQSMVQNVCGWCRPLGRDGEERGTQKKKLFPQPEETKQGLRIKK